MCSSPGKARCPGSWTSAPLFAPTCTGMQPMHSTPGRHGPIGDLTSDLGLDFVVIRQRMPVRRGHRHPKLRTIRLEAKS